MKKALIIVVLLVILLPTGLVLADIAFENTKVTTHTFPGPIDEIVVRSQRGDVELVPARGRGVTVRETRHYVLKEPTLERAVDAGVLTLEVRCPASFVTCFSDLRMSVPAGTRMTLETGSGDVEARGVDVREARVRSDSGDMRLELVGRQRLVRAQADSGDVDVVTRNVRAVDARTDSRDRHADRLRRRGRRRHLAQRPGCPGDRGAHGLGRRHAERPVITPGALLLSHAAFHPPLTRSREARKDTHARQQGRPRQRGHAPKAHPHRARDRRERR